MEGAGWMRREPGVSSPHVTPLSAPAFRSYFEIFNGHGEVDAQSLGSILLLVGISLTPAQVEDALMSADVDGEWGEVSSGVPGGASKVWFDALLLRSGDFS